jgi:hypothetical protein
VYVKTLHVIRRALTLGMLAAALAPATAAAAPSVTIDDVSHAEGDSGSSTMSFPVRLSEPAPAGGVTVTYATENGTAAAGADYTAAAGTATVAAGATSTVIDVPITGDTLSEENETLKVNLSNATNGATIGDAQGIGTIVDNDPLPSMRVNDVRVTEGNSGERGATFTISLSTASGRDVSVNFATSNGSAVAPADYTAMSGTLVIPAGSTSRTVSVAVKGDVLDESNETFNLNLSSASGASIADSRGVGTISDDDGAPSLAIADASVREGNSGRRTLAFAVTLSRASGKTVTVRYATSQRSATSGSDYVGTSGTLTFPAGSTSRTVSVSIVGDTRAESNETFLVKLSSNRNASIRRGTATGTILNDDPGPPRVSGFRVSPKAFRAATSGGSLTLRAVGTSVTYRLSHSARAAFTVQRLVRRRGRLRYIALRGSFSHASSAGLNQVRFSGRLRGRALAPGRYLLVIVAIDSRRLSSSARSVRFRIVR